MEERSIDITGNKLVSEFLRSLSLSFVKDFRMELKPEKAPLGVDSEGLEFLAWPKGRRERKERKVELFVEVTGDGEAATEATREGDE